MSESFSFDVDYSTTFKQIERLRSLMLGFVQMERRDFQPSFDIVVVGTCQCQWPKIASNIGLATKDIPDQQKMTLQADIMYKSNWQQGNLKCMYPLTQNDLDGSHRSCSLPATRRNKWICALKSNLAEAKIYGPKGDPDATPVPTRYTVVPWEEVREKDIKKSAGTVAPITMPEMPPGGYNLINRSVSKRKFSQA